MLAETLVIYMLAFEGIKHPKYEDTHANRIRILKNAGLLPKEISDTLYILRKARNYAAHEAADEKEVAKSNLHLLYELCVWFMQDLEIWQQRLQLSLVVEVQK